MESKCNDHDACKNYHKLFFNSTSVFTLMHPCTQECLIFNRIGWMGWMVRDSGIIFKKKWRNVPSSRNIYWSARCHRCLLFSFRNLYFVNLYTSPCRSAASIWTSMNTNFSSFLVLHLNVIHGSICIPYS